MRDVTLPIIYSFSVYLLISATISFYNDEKEIQRFGLFRMIWTTLDMFTCLPLCSSVNVESHDSLGNQQFGR